MVQRAGEGLTGFVKIYGSQLLGSSLMDEDVATRWLFMCFLSDADEGGFVRCQTTSGAARMANITEEQARIGLEALSAPDPNTTTPDMEGRRIIRCEGGWVVVNAQKYRDMRTPKQIANAKRQQAYRDRQGVTRNTSNAGVREASNSLSDVVVSVEEKNASAVGAEAGHEATSGDSDDERGRDCSGDGLGGERLHDTEERLAGLRGDSRGRHSVSRSETRFESGVHVGPAEAHVRGSQPLRDSRLSGSSQGSVDPRSDEDQVRGSNFRAAADLDVKILRACRAISKKTGEPAWKVMRRVTSYKRRDGTESAGVEDPSRLGSVLAREKALEDANAWIEHLEVGHIVGE